MNAKQTAINAIDGCGNFEDFATHQAAYGFLRRVLNHICEWTYGGMYANTSVEKQSDGKWRANVSAAYEA